MLAFWEGEFINIKDGKASLQDRGYVFGDGAYDALTTFNGKMFAADEHINRFFRSMNEMDINSPYSKEEVKDILQEGLERAGIDSSLVYFQTTRGTMPRSHAYHDGIVGNFMAMFMENYCFNRFRKGESKLISVKDDRWRRCDIKSLNLIANLMAANKAKKNGGVEALLVRDGFAAECAHNNVFRVKDGVVYTEPISELILAGISRKHVINIARRLGIEVVERHSTLDEFYNSDEVFITSCGLLVLPINKIDEVEIGNNHPVVDKLFEQYVLNVEKVCGKLDMSMV